METLTKILSVEDDPDIQAITRFALENVGKYIVEICGSGAEALKVAPVFSPDLILLDVMMPGMNGLETLLALRQLPQVETTPVVFMTAKVMRDDIEKFKSLSALGIIAKPFDPMSLSDEIRAIWEARHA